MKLGTDNISEKLDYFIALKITGELSAEREKVLNDWRTADPKNEEEYKKRLSEWGQEASKDTIKLPEEIEFLKFKGNH